MNISILKRKLRIINSMSRYNNVYYIMPIRINDCRILYEKTSEMCELTEYIVGNIYEGKKFVAKYWLHPEEIRIEDSLELYFSDKTIDDKNNWT